MHAYGYGPDDWSAQRDHIIAQSDVFMNVSSMPEMDAAGHMAMAGVDIVVDLMAHTRGTKLGIAAVKPAPLLVNYLGFPGTMGSLYGQCFVSSQCFADFYSILQVHRLRVG